MTSAQTEQGISWRREAALYALAVLLAMLAGYTDIHSDDPPPGLITLLVPSFLLACWQPRWPWRWGLIVGAGVPLAHVLASYGLLSMKFPNDVVGSFCAIIVGVLASLAGAWVRRQSGPVNGPDERYGEDVR